jgi:hypothetical protein
MEKVLLALLIGHILGVGIFAKFESESPWWRWVLKWTIILGIVYGLAVAFNPAVALYVLIGLFILSVIIHFAWCRSHGIHPIHATPRRKYYELRGWKWEE